MTQSDLLDVATRPAPTPTLTHLFSMRVELGASHDGGDGPLGRRLHDIADRGTFAGPRLRGEVMAGSADSRLVRRDGVSVMDARVVLKTHDGAIIHMRYGGRIIVPPELLSQVRDPARRHLVDPTLYSLRTAPMFETGAEAYRWLNDLTCVGSGRLTQQGLEYEIFQVG